MIKFNYVCSEEFVSASYSDMPPRKLNNEYLMSTLWGTLQCASYSPKQVRRTHDQNLTRT